MRGILGLLCGLLLSGLAIASPRQAHAQQMSFNILADRAGCLSCIWLQATGEIADETPQQLDAFLRQNPFVSIVQLDSGGGKLAAALEVGNIVRSRNLITVVGGAKIDARPSADRTATRTAGQCISACAYILAAGRERSQVAGSAIGVHQFSGGVDSISGADALDVGQRMTGVLIEYLSRMGVNPAMIAAAGLLPVSWTRT